MFGDIYESLKAKFALMATLFYHTICSQTSIQLTNHYKMCHVKQSALQVNTSLSESDIPGI